MQKITVAHGDGIGPEIMNATLDILKAAGARLEYEEIEVGEKVYLSGNTSGIDKTAWDSIRRNKVFLKAPITTPQGGGYKSLNVTMRKALGLYANVRPCKSFHPFVRTKHPDMDVVVIRENEEDLYAGIEHQQTDEVVQCLKLITRPGCERIIRYAFEYAKLYKRKKVSCFTKDNIMKHTDGLFHRVFKEIAVEYPDIQSDNWIIDIGAAKLADTPEMFDVVAHYQVPYVLMHMRGTPKTMQQLTHYDDMMGELIHFFSERIQMLNLKGVHDIIIDPGFGFSKTIAQNFYLLQHLSELHILNTPILAGLSRKSFIYKTLDIEAGDALNGTSAVNMLALQQGVEILRVHDVKECKELVNLYTFMKNQ